jgi:hypothetical protein
MLPHLESIDPKIPTELRETYSHLCGEVLRINEKLREYRELFAKDEKRLALLNESGPFLFFLIEQLFYDDLILSLSRLLDTAVSQQKKTPNLTLFQLVEKTKLCNLALAIKLESQAKQIKQDAEPMQKHHRNQRIGHNDYANAVAVIDPLPPVQLNLIEQVISSSEALLPEFHRTFTGREEQFEIFNNDDGAIILLDRLFKARAYDDLEKKKMIPIGYHGILAKKEGFI